MSNMMAMQSKVRARRRAYVGTIVVLAIAIVALALFLNWDKARNSIDPAGFEHATVVYVIDGDTIDVELAGSEGGEPKRERVRLIGIDAPESANYDEALNTPEGALATAHARELLSEGATVYLQTDTTEHDKYGRLLRYVWLELPNNPDDEAEIAAKMLDARMVADGYAQAIRYEPDTRYASVLERLQRDAVARGAGVSFLWK